MTLLSPERPADLSGVPQPAPSRPQPAGQPLRRPAGLPAAVAPHLARLPALRDRLVLLATIVWLAGRVSGRLAALAARRLAAWFAADPRRPRTAAAGVALAATVGALIGLVVGLVLTGCWVALRGLVVHDLT
jgi:hypothetical protein